jgi:histidinol phosphatase-like enzyme
LEIIFLDIDGVLNSKTYYKTVDRTKKDWNRFNPLVVEMIKRLIEEFKSSIVISLLGDLPLLKNLKMN